MPDRVLPTLAARPLTVLTVLVSAASGSVSLESTLPEALGVPGKAVLPGLTPDSTTAFESATATGGLLTATTAVTVTFTVAVEVPPWPSLMV